ncbi:BrnA antitoxin family protein [Aureimonas fodinaquatilis]|uniref:BrnA antitoxin family protein n=1 Tax=Aureimonas fodinaquatilis TaxID=2565783 RepID=A0A5B0DUT1_9HYPH|nr:BrnA antitoxin family protein [Aureimonas fodinaquatilis]KAA0970567.1 BrnA antitoxin family protein [Aureimonas fodinaquatilis]
MKKPLTNEVGDVRELSKGDMRLMKPFAEMHPELAKELHSRGRGQRGPGKKLAKESVNLRLNAEIVQHFRSGGPGWQSRINDALLKIIEKH